MSVEGTSVKNPSIGSGSGATTSSSLLSPSDSDLKCRRGK